VTQCRGEGHGRHPQTSRTRGDELAAKSAEANVIEPTRKRTARRTGIKEQARALLAHSPELNYVALADVLNIGDRRGRRPDRAFPSS
jgi:hypothetical protein